MSAQSFISAQYDPRVKVAPCDPDRVPHLPVQILYLIALALPNPKSVLNFALSSKQTWQCLQPALFQSEVTYESRLGGSSSDSLQQHFRRYLQGSVDDHDCVTGLGGSDQNLPARGTGCHHGRPPGQCDVCVERNEVEDRSFESPYPRDLLFADRKLTALHWACKQGASALPVALKAINSAEVLHRRSYIDGVGLRERLYPDRFGKRAEKTPADLPPPLFFAVAYGNIEVCKALVEAGCNVNLLQGQSVCRDLCRKHDRWENLMAFKIHEECAPGRMGATRVDCASEWAPGASRRPAAIRGCQTAGHVAIHYEQMEMLEVLLRSGLDVQKGLVPLINYSAAKGNAAAVRMLVEHDPSLIHGALQAVVSEALTYRHGSGVLPMPIPMPKLMDLLTTAEYLVRRGANWNQMTLEDSFIHQRGLLERSVFKAVFISSTRFLWEGNIAQALQERQGWGRLLKAMVETTAARGVNAERFSDAFTCLVNFRGHWFDHVDTHSQFGPWGTEAVGRLLLSTGITPDPEEIEEWKTLCIDREQWSSEDGDLSQWGFLLAGIDADQPKIERGIK